MTGPFHWNGIFERASGSTYRHLCSGRKYRVRQPFEDYDGDLHPVDETWTFLGHTYLPHDDGLTLFVSLDGRRAWCIRLQCLSGAQKHIDDQLESYVALEPIHGLSDLVGRIATALRLSC